MKVLCILGLMTLAGCGTFDTVKEVVAVKGAEIMDDTLNDSEWFICNGASVGSVRRRYGDSSDRSFAWRQLCEPKTNATVLNPKPD